MSDVRSQVSCQITETESEIERHAIFRKLQEQTPGIPPVDDEIVEPIRIVVDLVHESAHGFSPRSLPEIRNQIPHSLLPHRVEVISLPMLAEVYDAVMNAERKTAG